MAKKSKRGSGPRPGSDRAERIAARRARAEETSALLVATRPFAGLACECDLVALRAFVASATAPAPLRSAGNNQVELGTILAGAVPALTRDIDSQTVGFAGLQTDPEPDDIADSLASALIWASDAPVGEIYEPVSEAGSLTDILDPDAQLDITVHEDFGWWFDDNSPMPAELAQVMEQADSAIMPSARVDVNGRGAPWWVDAGERAHLRWVRPEDEDAVMNGLARVHAQGQLTLGEGSRFAGSFRTHGLLVPVFDLDVEMHAEEWVGPCTEFDKVLTEAIAQTAELTAAERRSRDGIRSRQVTLR
ncbi:DUF5926 family protein [Gordonia jinhuaensis]|uniref:DUF5926 domain-containing protein n=1 Tax=Gordonia jinhuaensis TaxID=1517702 RepID=A0A916X097_9ACTN|nr:DUF5926 family protein [Gordonia jinhuaensis]GGB43258.1 hypothetical protein GCM10011489_33460 [Gordonia jinhuaensis]